jgi:hypothetical protein
MLAEWIATYGLGMSQLTLAAMGFERYAKTTRRARFLTEMEGVVPWSALCTLIEPFYPGMPNNHDAGNPPFGFLLNVFLSDIPRVPENIKLSLAPLGSLGHRNR